MGRSCNGKSEGAESVTKVKQALEKFISTGINNFSIQELYDRSRELKTPPCAYVGLDTALWDWQAKEGLPLYKLRFSKAQNTYICYYWN